MSAGRPHITYGLFPQKDPTTEVEKKKRIVELMVKPGCPPWRTATSGREGETVGLNGYDTTEGGEERRKSSKKTP